MIIGFLFFSIEEYIMMAMNDENGQPLVLRDYQNCWVRGQEVTAGGRTCEKNLVEHAYMDLLTVGFVAIGLGLCFSFCYCHLLDMQKENDVYREYHERKDDSLTPLQKIIICELYLLLLTPAFYLLYVPRTWMDHMTPAEYNVTSSNGNNITIEDGRCSYQECGFKGTRSYTVSYSGREYEDLVLYITVGYITLTSLCIGLCIKPDALSKLGEKCCSVFRSPSTTHEGPEKKKEERIQDYGSV